MALIRLLTVMCSMLHLWNWLKLVSKGHWWGRHLLSLLIQHHGRTLPEGSVLNSSLTLAASGRCPHHIILDFVIWRPLLFHFKFAQVPFVRKLLFPDMPQKALDIRLASCAGLPTDVQEWDLRQKVMNWNLVLRNRKGWNTPSSNSSPRCNMKPCV